MNLSNLEKSKIHSFYWEYNKKINALFMTFLVLVFGNLLFPGFLSWVTVVQIIRISAIIGIFAICQVVIMAVGQGVDVSTGYIATIAAVIAVTVIDGQNTGMLIGMPLGVIVGAIFGLANGLGVVYLKIPSLLMTLAMGVIIAGAMNIYTGGRIISGRAAPLMQVLFARISFWIIPNLVIIWVIIGIIVMLVMYKTKWGSVLRAVGDNKVAAALNGINVKLVTVLAFVTSGAVAGFAGMVLLGFAGRAMRDLGIRYMLPSIAACVVGGVSIWGGDGDYFAVMIGAFAMETVRIMFYVVGWGDSARYIGYGLVIVIMLAVYGRKAMGER